MKLKDLIDRLNFIATLHKNDLDDITVVIETADDYLSGQNIVLIKDVSLGFDWTKNKLIISPTQSLIRKVGG